MCGRYVTIKKIKEIEERFGAYFKKSEDYEPNYNLKVGDMAPVITDRDPGVIQFFKFGFSPGWTKKQMYLFNARSEGNYNKENDPDYDGPKGILQKPSFAKAIRTQRCLVLADGFIEGSKQKKLNEPFLIYPRNKEPFAMAGIWSEWINKETGEVHLTFAIITTVANNLLQKIGHERSPVVLSKEDEKVWLDQNTDINTIMSLLKPFDARAFNAYPISNEIRSGKINDFRLLTPIGPTIYKEDAYITLEDTAVVF